MVDEMGLTLNISRFEPESFRRALLNIVPIPLFFICSGFLCTSPHPGVVECYSRENWNCDLAMNSGRRS